MSQQIADISLTGATVGQTGTIPTSGVLPVSSPTLAQQMQPDTGNLPVVVVFNESPCIILLSLPNSNQSLSLPSGRWVQIPIPANETVLRYTVQAIATGTALFNNLLADYYAPGEPVEELGVLGNSPIGGQVGTTMAQQLVDPNGNGYLSVAPIGIGSPILVELRPNANNTGAAGMALQTYDGTTVTDNLVINSQGQITLVGTILSLIGEPVATGALGMPVVDGLTQARHVTATTAQTILSITPANTGTYRISGYLFLNNGTSGNVLTARFSFNDPDGGGARTFFMRSDNGSSSNALNGVNSFANGAYSLAPYTFRHTGGQAITVTYTDPTNTPSDFFTVFVERIA